MHYSKIIFSLSTLCTIVLIASCQLPVGNWGNKETEISGDTKDSIETLTPRGYIKRGIDYLQVGDEENARRYLNAALAANPNNRTAKFLLKQLEVDPLAYLGRESFSYSIQYGQTLSQIAKQFLGNELKFYILARYNGIDNPSRLEVGQTIKIPGSPTASRGATDEEPPEDDVIESITPDHPSDEVSGEETEILANLNELVPDESNEVVTEVTDTPHEPDEPENGSIPAADETDRVKEIIAQADTLRAEGRLERAKAKLQEALALQPDNLNITQRLAAVDKSIRERNAESLYRQGLAEIQAGQLEAAYYTFQQAQETDPDNILVQGQIAEIKPRLVSDYHRQALLSYNAQKVCEAAGMWEKVLELNPDYSPAMVYQLKAQRIIEKQNLPCQ